jgi:hypothetical protein
MDEWFVDGRVYVGKRNTTYIYLQLHREGLDGFPFPFSLFSLRGKSQG